MIQEDYVSFETAKLLKEKGFSEWCFKCYGVAVLHNGADISFDEECELKDEGRENEIEYVEGGRHYDYGCNNRDKDAKVWAAPTLWVAMKWLREVHLLNISIFSYFKDYDKYVHGWSFFIHKLSFEDGRWNWDDSVYAAIDKKSSDDKIYETYEEACESAIGHCLENLI